MAIERSTLRSDTWSGRTSFPGAKFRMARMPAATARSATSCAAYALMAGGWSPVFATLAAACGLAVWTLWLARRWRSR